MERVLKSTTPSSEQLDITQHPWRRRLLCSLLLAIALTVFLTGIEIGLILLLNPLHLMGNMQHRFFALLIMLPFYWPASRLVPLSEMVIASIAIFLLTRVVALMKYARAVYHAQQTYHKLYIPLTAVASIRKMDEPYQASGYDPESPMSPTLYRQDEQVSLLDFVQQGEFHQLILGAPGSGKTMALRVYQSVVSQSYFSLAFRQYIPIYVPMKHYSLFLKQKKSLGHEHTDQDMPHITLIHYLQSCDLPGMRYLRPYLQKLFEQGHLLLLCDGLNEIDNDHLSLVINELVYLMRETRNRLVMTCREVDYREQHEFVQLVDEGKASCVIVYPLQYEKMHELVELYVQKQDKRWQHTAGQILQVIDRSRLYYHCTNPMMLFTLMGVIDQIGIERGKQLDTRGRLLREYVKQVIAHEGQQARWKCESPAQEVIINFLSEVACAARWANDRTAIQLPVSSLLPPILDSQVWRQKNSRVDFQELAVALCSWQDKHPAQGPFVVESDKAVQTAMSYVELPRLLQFTLSAALIDISPSGVLSFRHELIAEYFVAEYFFKAASKTEVSKQTSSLTMQPELLENVGSWSQLVAIWAGLLDNPLELAECFSSLGLQDPSCALQALALGLICIGVLWAPPQAEIQCTVILPPSIEEALSIALRDRDACEELARIFTRCAEEGSQEIYRSLLPLIMVEGIDDLLTLLDFSIVPDLLFEHLQDAADNIAYEAQVKRLTRILGRFGGVVVGRTAQLSFPAPDRSTRLQAAAINILGGTNDSRAVEPLLARLRDADSFIVERATNALIRLGPNLTLTHVLQHLECQAENRTPDPLTVRVHQATLIILGYFMDEQCQISPMQYMHILERIVPVLTSNYQAEPHVQVRARQILVREGRKTTGIAAHDHRWKKVIEALIGYLPSEDDVVGSNVMQVLQEIGMPATPPLVDLLNHPAEIVRVRVISILQVTRDLSALPEILQLIYDPSSAVQQQVAAALRSYAPESIAGLVELVIDGSSDVIAERCMQILVSIGVPVVEPVMDALPKIIPERTCLLVQVLATVHDLRAVTALIALLQTPQLKPLLSVTIVRALGQFQDPQVVPPLLSVLSSTNPLLYEQAITVLSLLGDIALPSLIGSLNVEQEFLVTQRVQRAILGIMPFPGDQLILALEKSTAVQEEQIMAIFVQQGSEAALVLVKHLLHSDKHVCEAIHRTLEQVQGAIAVPALLDALSQEELRKVAGTFLLKYPEAAIPPLVNLLAEPDLGKIASGILPQFGLVALRPLVTGLDDRRPQAHEFARHVIVTLVDQSADKQIILHQIVHLFNPPPPVHAHEELIGILTHDLAEIILDALLVGLEDAYLIDGVAEAFVRLAHKPEKQTIVLNSLVKSLFVDERRRGAEVALTWIGAAAVLPIGELITSRNQAVAKSAKQILRDIGVPALRFIWVAHSDRGNVARRKSAMEVFRSMPTEVIKDELIALLVSDRHDDIAMSVALLLERIGEESKQSYEERIMVPGLVEYVQTHTVESLNLRIIALLLLLGEQAIVDHMIQALEDYVHPRKQLIYILLLLGNEAQELLLQVFNDPDVAMDLRLELATVLGMTSAPKGIIAYAQNISSYGLATNRTDVMLPEQLSIALRALGGLLGSGYWNVQKLLDLCNSSKSGEPAHELFSILLGWRYEPQIAKLQSDLEAQRETFKNEILALTKRILTEQKRVQQLESELEKLQQEHGSRGDELYRISRERDAFRAKIDQFAKEKATLQTALEQVSKEKAALADQLQRVLHPQSGS